MFSCLVWSCAHKIVNDSTLHPNTTSSDVLWASPSLRTVCTPLVHDQFFRAKYHDAECWHTLTWPTIACVLMFGKILIISRERHRERLRIASKYDLFGCFMIPSSSFRTVCTPLVHYKACAVQLREMLKYIDRHYFVKFVNIAQTRTTSLRPTWTPPTMMVAPPSTLPPSTTWSTPVQFYGFFRRHQAYVHRTLWTSLVRDQHVYVQYHCMEFEIYSQTILRGAC